MVIGSDLIGTQTVIYLGQKDHNVTVLRNEKKLDHDAPPVHYFSTVQLMYETTNNFKFITEVNVTGISKEKVTYVDVKGNERSL